MQPLPLRRRVGDADLRAPRADLHSKELGQGREVRKIIAPSFVFVQGFSWVIT